MKYILIYLCLGMGEKITERLLNLNAIVYGVDKEGYASTGEWPSLRKYDLDVSDWENVYKTILSIGPVHGLVNNAGVAVIESFFDVTKSGWDE